MFCWVYLISCLFNFSLCCCGCLHLFERACRSCPTFLLLFPVLLVVPLSRLASFAVCSFSRVLSSVVIGWITSLVSSSPRFFFLLVSFSTARLVQFHVAVDLLLMLRLFQPRRFSYYTYQILVCLFWILFRLRVIRYVILVLRPSAEHADHRRSFEVHVQDALWPYLLQHVAVSLPFAQAVRDFPFVLRRRRFHQHPHSFGQPTSASFCQVLTCPSQCRQRISAFAIDYF